MSWESGSCSLAMELRAAPHPERSLGVVSFSLVAWPLGARATLQGRRRLYFISVMQAEGFLLGRIM